MDLLMCEVTYLLSCVVVSLCSRWVAGLWICGVV